MRRTAVVVLVAAAAVAGVVLWPASPRWRVAVEPGQAVGFADANTVVRSIGGESITLVRHDAATGAERSRVTLADLPAELMGAGTVTLSPGGRRAVVTRSYVGTNGWVLYDAVRGTRLTPFVVTASAEVTPLFSPDGRWFDVAVRNANQSGAWTPTPRDAATGAPLAARVPAPGEQAYVVAFRGDGGRVAIVWGPQPGAAGPTAWRVEVVALPAGEVVNRFPLPAGGWHSAAEYRGDRLTLLDVSLAATGTRRRGVTFDVAATPVGPGVAAPEWAVTELGWTDWQPGPTGPGWATRVRCRPRSRFLDRLHRWAVERGWVAPAGSAYGTEQRLRFVNPATKAVRSELPAWLDGWPVVSPDGRWVVALHDGRLNGWSADPPWPRGALAMIAAGAVLLVGRRRKR